MSAKRSARGTFLEVDDLGVAVDVAVEVDGDELRGGVGGGPLP